MEPGSATIFAVTLALIGIVIIISSLLSGFVERSGFPQVAVFLLLGLVLGPAGLDLLDFPLHSATLAVLATLGLVLVLFSDALSVNVAELRQQRLAPLLLGPGTLLPAVINTFAAWWLLGLRPAGAAVLGASLASTDPVLLRALLRHPRLSHSARLALRLESGLNDAVLLPIVVLAMLFLDGANGGASQVTAQELTRHAVGLFLLGPGLGVVIGWLALTALDRVRTRLKVRRDYESIYALGVAFTAFAAAQAVGGSGFLAAFAAGLVIASMDVELCDCFLDYGEASAEMFLLLTFVAFGTSPIWGGLTVVSWRTLAFAAVALLARTAVLYPILGRGGLDEQSRRLVAWFGPRGLSTLLLVLLPVFDGIPGSERLFEIAALVVLLSVVLHGGGIVLFMRRAALAAAAPAAPASAAATPAAVPASAEGPAPRATDAASRSASPASEPERIDLDELRALWRTGAPVVLLDVRTDRAYASDERRARGAIRISPDDAVGAVTRLNLPRDATLVAFCA